MPLQADPTVIFAIKRKDNDFDRLSKVFYKDLTMSSPYNTYVNIGLPPGPIAIYITAEKQCLRLRNDFIFFWYC
jgi:UPF0755 protein